MDSLKKIYKKKVRGQIKTTRGIYILLPILIIVSIILSLIIYTTNNIIHQKLLHDCSISLQTEQKDIQVYVDNQYIGIAPVSNIPVTCQNHTVQIGTSSSKFYKNLDLPLVLEPNTTVNIQILLGPSDNTTEYVIYYIKPTAHTPQMSITTNPQGVEIKLNNKAIGKTPIYTSDITPSNYILEFSHNDYKELKVQLDIQEAADIKIFANLINLPIKLENE